MYSTIRLDLPPRDQDRHVYGERYTGLPGDWHVPGNCRSGYNTNTGTNTISLMALSSVFLPQISYFAFRERFSWQIVARALIAMSRVALLSLIEHRKTNSPNDVGHSDCCVWRTRRDSNPRSRP